MHDARAKHQRIDSPSIATIDWTAIGAQVRRLATIATVEHLEQQRVAVSGGAVPRFASIRELESSHVCGEAAR